MFSLRHIAFLGALLVPSRLLAGAADRLGWTTVSAQTPFREGPDPTLRGLIVVVLFVAVFAAVGFWIRHTHARDRQER